MFEILPNPSMETIMLIGRGALLFGAFWIFALAFTRWRRAEERRMQHVCGEIQRMFAEVRSLHETIAVMSARMESLNERADTDSRLTPVSTGSSQRGYDLAARLVRNGAGVEELVATCGISRHEADLLTRLHASKSRESAPQAAAGRKRGSLLSVVG
ncbi:MAG TPA: DUF2802 domain-containing protein [Steroidobacteraceae bacterium]|nr:DUF2802 domain-containing protein [Steroidobacteraceae bacterium]